MTAFNFTLVDSISPWVPGHVLVARAYYDLNGVALAQNDTITATGIIPSDGVEVMETVVVFTEIDVNTTPTGTFTLGDSGDADRFITSAPMGMNGVTTAAVQMRTGINRVTGTTSGVISTGAGYRYTGTTASTLIMTVDGVVATSATTGVVHLLVTYRCVGNS